ncbi:MAG: hypothetical protein BMS9Abin36_0659 [Gammaproteobacteria bacterium]|nr:MAG: hypothetical protein BMS9Abin36_0659 [Gammaproteobacteria bacterium]
MTQVIRYKPLALICVALLVTGCAYDNNKSPYSAAVGSKAAQYATHMVGARYRFGGNNPKSGFDCSGLVQYSYAKAGARVARDTRGQKKTSRAISVKQLQKGDLLFFHQQGKRYSHVGIYVGNNQFVHAPSSGKRVSKDTLGRYWRKHLASTRRFRSL